MQVDGDESSSGTQGSLMMMKSLDQKEGSKSLTDVMIRRLKNRERQRRYRARKRLLEADNVSKSHSLNLTSITKEAKPGLNDHIEKHVTRVHCKRDWKKDARMAHAYKVQDKTADSCGNQTPSLPSGIAGEVPETSEKPTDLLNIQMQKSRLGRRDWKADARNKKN